MPAGAERLQVSARKRSTVCQPWALRGEQPVSPDPFNQRILSTSQTVAVVRIVSPPEFISGGSTYGGDDRFVRTDVVICLVEVLLVVLWRADKFF